MTSILFDLDGTLLDTLQDLADSVNYSLELHGYPRRTVKEVRSFVGTGAANLIRLSVPQGADYEPVLATYQEYYRTHCTVKTGPYPGILDALEKIRAKYPVAVVSNKPDGAVKALCADFFGNIYARGESTDCPRKPAPDMLYKAMEALGMDRAIYVGDSEVDVITAANAGMPCISVLWGFRDEAEIRANGGIHFCSDPARLPQLVDSLAE